MSTFEEISDELAKAMDARRFVTAPTPEEAYQSFWAAGQYCRFCTEDLFDSLRRYRTQPNPSCRSLVVIEPPDDP